MYYRACVKGNLERQVGSRYFVSAANAAKIFFLYKAAVMFLKYTEKDMGNKLERCLYQEFRWHHVLFGVCGIGHAGQI